MMNNFAASPTMTPSQEWVEMAEKDRLYTINGLLWLGMLYKSAEAVEAKDDGHVTLTLRDTMSASERGTFLLDVEAMLKKRFDLGITVWLAPLGDKNSLRNLRGIEMK